MAEEDINNFRDQMALERKYYLGYTDTIPGTSILVADARADHREQQAEANKQMELRRIEYLKREKPQEGAVITTVVTPGVLANVEPKSQIEVSEAEIQAIDSGAADNLSVPEVPELPARAALKREGKEALYGKASAVRDLPPIEEITVEKLIDVILDENVNIE